MNYKRIVAFFMGIVLFHCAFYLLIRYVDFDTEETIVAVLDTGVDYNHEMLKGKVMKGWDFPSFDNDPMDEDGHGTHVAGTIVKIAPTAKIMPVRLIDKENPLYFDSVVPILYSIINGADVVNMSFSGEYSRLTQWVITLGVKKGVTFVASTGNSSLKNDIEYPAKYDGVIAVAAFDEDRKTIYEASNLGEAVDFVAPGVNVNSADIGNTYANRTGTSMSTAHVSGLVAKMNGETPMTPKEIYDRFVGLSNEITVDNRVYRAIDSVYLEAQHTKSTYIWRQGIKKNKSSSYEYYLKTINAQKVTVYVDGQVLKEVDGNIQDQFNLKFEDGIHEVVTVAEHSNDGNREKQKADKDTTTMRFPIDKISENSTVDVQRVIIDTVKPVINVKRDWIGSDLLMMIKVEDFTLKDVKITTHKKTVTYKKEALGSERIYLSVKPTDFPIHIEASDYIGNTSQLRFKNIQSLR